MVLRRGIAHLDPFNGSNEMLSIKRSEDEPAAAGPHHVVFTARIATGSVWSKTVVIPLFADRQ